MNGNRQTLDDLGSIVFTMCAPSTRWLALSTSSLTKVRSFDPDSVVAQAAKSAAVNVDRAKLGQRLGLGQANGADRWLAEHGRWHGAQVGANRCRAKSVCWPAPHLREWPRA